MARRGAGNTAWLDSAEASALLGVKRETLYAYASRGKLRTQQVGRKKRYLRADLERLAANKRARSGHGAVAAGALRWGEPVLDSAITEILPDGHRYRGRAAVTLAEACRFEEVAEHLWGTSPADGASEAARRSQRHWAQLRWPQLHWPLAPSKLFALMSREARPVDTLAMVLPALAVHDAQRVNHEEDASRAVARRLIRCMAATLALPRGARAARHALEQPTVADTVLCAFGVPARPATRHAVERALILCADHGLNPSAFAARVAASAGADLYACVTAALATLSGTLHGGMPSRVLAVMSEIDRASRAARVIGDRLQRGETIPGFGHPLYPAGDPRTGPLIEAARRVAPRGRHNAIVEAMVETMHLLGAEGPTVDVGLAAVASALGLPAGGATALFAIGRAAGWVAQVLEQRRAGFVLRPRARYVGPAAVT